MIGKHRLNLARGKPSPVQQSKNLYKLYRSSYYVRRWVAPWLSLRRRSINHLLTYLLRRTYLLNVAVTKYKTNNSRQEAQLPLRNRTLAMHFFVAFYRRNDLLLRLSRSKSTSGKFGTHTANKLQHATTARSTPLSFDVAFLENPCDYPHKLYIARN